MSIPTNLTELGKHKSRRVRKGVLAGSRKIYSGVKKQEQKGKEYRSGNTMKKNKEKIMLLTSLPVPLYGIAVLETC